MGHIPTVREVNDTYYCGLRTCRSRDIGAHGEGDALICHTCGTVQQRED